MKSSRLEEDKNIKENITKDIRNFLYLKKTKEKTNDTAIKDIRNLFQLKNANKLIKDRILTDIKNLFKHGDIRNIFRFKKKL